ncbi:MAG: glycosyltransferase family 2 protein [Acidobacteria bacterium]|nr:glycosyltransferase family 2 protein [Acidobacteriota bacterium]MBV9146036.1 glycosyltransferase family 2 protein [Acidobacteriota bacterium]MBV9436161.1 glycosyltransferase family 2 protein [Acidobacteriota bacterium]
MYSLSIVIPAFNEERRLEASLQKLDAFIHSENLNAEIIVVDDGSTDATARLVMRFIQDKPYLRLLQNHINRGKGYSLRRGVEAALGEIILVTDADLSVPIKELDRLLAAIEDGADVAIGSRGIDLGGERVAAPWHRRLCSAGFKMVVRSILGLRFEDTQCGFKAFKRKAARMIFSRQRIERWGFDPEVLMLAERFCFVVKEVGVEAVHDNGSRLNVVRDSFQMLCEVLKIRYHLLFGMYNYVTASHQVISPATTNTAPVNESLEVASATSN